MVSVKDGNTTPSNRNSEAIREHDWDLVKPQVRRTGSSAVNKQNIHEEMNTMRTKRASSILFNKDPTKLTLDKKDKEFLWGYVKNYEDSQDFVLYCGTSFHKQLWLRASGALAQKEANPGYYSTLKCLSADYPSPDFAQIEIDAIRSYASMKNDAHRKEQEQRLTDLLHAFVKRNPKVGYF